jgi:hypothetical protein
VYVAYAQWIGAHDPPRFVNRSPILGVLARWLPSFASYFSPCTFAELPDPTRYATA